MNPHPAPGFGVSFPAQFPGATAMAPSMAPAAAMPAGFPCAHAPAAAMPAPPQFAATAAMPSATVPGAVYGMPPPAPQFAVPGAHPGHPAVALPQFAPAPPPAPARPPAPSLFGLVVPGRSVVTEFIPVGGNKFATQIEGPSQIGEVSFFLLPGSGIPDCGVALYYSIPPFEHWELLGAVTRKRPSAIFRTSWPAKPEMRGVPVVRLGVSIETEAFADNLESASAATDDRSSVAVKVAENLFRFMESFVRTIPDASGEVLVAPTNVLDRWLEQFKAKHSTDPTFVFKK